MEKIGNRKRDVDVLNTQEPLILCSRALLDISDQYHSPPPSQRIVRVKDSYAESQSRLELSPSSSQEERHHPIHQEEASGSMKRKELVSISACDVLTTQDHSSSQATKRQRSAGFKRKIASTVTKHAVDAASSSTKTGRLTTARSSLTALKSRHPVNEEDVLSISSQVLTSDGDDDSSSYQEPQPKRQKIVGVQNKKISVKSPAIPVKRVGGAKTKSVRRKPGSVRTGFVHETVIISNNAIPTSAQQPKQCDPVRSTTKSQRPQETAWDSLSMPDSKSKPGETSLVDENTEKKVHIIAFDECGPRNQGQTPLSATKITAHLQQVRSECDVTRDMQESAKLGAHLHQSTKQPRRTTNQLGSVERHNASADHPLAGYARYLPSVLPRSTTRLNLDSSTREISSQPSPRRDVDAEDDGLLAIDNDCCSTDVMSHRTQVEAATASQLGLPLLVCAAEDAQRQASATAPVAVMLSSHCPQQAGASSPSQDVHSVNVCTGLPTNDAVRPVRSTSATNEELSQHLILQPASQVMEEMTQNATMGNQSRNKLDDSGYRSLQALQSQKAIRSRKLRTARPSLIINALGSPVVQPQAVGNGVVPEAVQPWPIQDPNPDNPFCRQQTSSRQARELRLKRLPQHVEDDSSSVNALDGVPTMCEDSVTSLRKQCFNPSRLADDEKSHKDMVEEIMEWRKTLLDHHLSLFDLLLSDAHHLVAQLARREGLIQDRVQLFRNKGKSLMLELASAHAQEYKLYRQQQQH